MEYRTLKWLDISEMKIIKHIIIISDRNKVEIELGSIIYTRPISESYKFKKEKEENETEVESRVLQLIKGYPNQKNYPSDLIDKMIISAIKKTYPKSSLRNDTIFLDVDGEKLDSLKNRNSCKSKIYFSPEFSQFNYYGDYVGKEFKAPVININIYSHDHLDFLDNQLFYADYDATKPNELNELESLDFQ